MSGGVARGVGRTSRASVRQLMADAVAATRGGPTYGIRIDPDGTVEAVTVQGVAEWARSYMRDTLADDMTVVSLTSPHTPRHADGRIQFVGFVTEWGRANELPLNIKAWALYGRSPIVGPMFVALDGDDGAGGREPLPPEFVDLMRSDGWIEPPVLAAMRSMLGSLNDGYPVPEWNWPPDVDMAAMVAEQDAEAWLEEQAIEADERADRDGV